MLATPSRFTSGQELPALQAIERFIGQKIPRLKLENFSYLYTALFESESADKRPAHNRWRKNPSRLFIRATKVTQASCNRIVMRPLFVLISGSSRLHARKSLDLFRR